MKIHFKKIAIFSGVCMFFTILGCSSPEPNQDVAMANPASEHCVKKGGKLEIIKEAAGEKGMCHLPDGTLVEEWELFRRDKPQD